MCQTGAKQQAKKFVTALLPAYLYMTIREQKFWKQNVSFLKVANNL